MIALLVAVGAVVGAPARYTADVLISRRTSGFPFGTLTVNVVGSLVLGLVAGLALHHGLSDHIKALVGTGFCGAFTTFSTFSQETATLARTSPAKAAANLVGSTAAGLLAAAAGLGLALT